MSMAAFVVVPNDNSKIKNTKKQHNTFNTTVIPVAAELK